MKLLVYIPNARCKVCIFLVLERASRRFVKFYSVGKSFYKNEMLKFLYLVGNKISVNLVRCGGITMGSYINIFVAF